MSLLRQEDSFEDLRTVLVLVSDIWEMRQAHETRQLFDSFITLTHVLHELVFILSKSTNLVIERLILANSISKGFLQDSDLVSE